jgi:hypothetical protein
MLFDNILKNMKERESNKKENKDLMFKLKDHLEIIVNKSGVEKNVQHYKKK